MRAALLASPFIGLVAALPAPQDIDFDLAYALPNPTFTEAVGVTAQTVSYNPTTVYAAAADQVTSSLFDSVAEATATDAPSNAKRAAACASEPAGFGPVPSPDTASNFLSFASFSSAAVSAPTPSGYVQQFSNLQAANNAYGYLGYTTLKTYDVNACATKCNAIANCLSINIYFERDPSVNPGVGDSSCANPPSTTNIKCSFWGGPVNAENAVNKGQWRNNFQVVIAGSNGYTSSSIASLPGYSQASPLGNAAINAPLDQYGYDSYLGNAMFVGAFDASLCAKACSEKSAYALAHPPTDGSPVQTCQFFNTYVLYINKTSNVQGQYCAMYAQSWSSKYATNVGQWRGNDHFMINYSFSYSNSSNPGVPNPKAAVYQAKRDILWPGNSAEPYCSSILGYTTPVVTSTTVATFTPAGTTTTTAMVTTFTTSTTASPTTVTTTTTATIAKRDGVTDVTLADVTIWTTIDGTAVRVPPTLPTELAQLAQETAQKRDVAVPQVLTKYPASIIRSACALAVSPATSTSTAISTTTTTVATAYTVQTDSATTTITSIEITVPTLTTTVSTTTTTTTSPPPACTTTYNVQIVNYQRYRTIWLGAWNPATPDKSADSAAYYSFGRTYPAYDRSSAQDWTLRPDGRLYGSNDTFALATGNTAGPFLSVALDDSVAYYKWTYARCTVRPNPDVVGLAVPGAVGELVCTQGVDVPVDLYICSFAEVGIFVMPKGSSFSSCYRINLAALPISSGPSGCV